MDDAERDAKRAAARAIGDQAAARLSDAFTESFARTLGMRLARRDLTRGPWLLEFDGTVTRLATCHADTAHVHYHPITQPEEEQPDAP